MAGSLLRTRDGHHARVGFVELFFDLVFVFAVTQISHALLGHQTLLGALQAGMMLMAVWWGWNYTSWVTNWLDPETAAVRLLLFALMGAGLVLSTSLPEAFGDKGLVFALAFVTLQVGRTVFMLWAVRSDPMLSRNFLRILIWLSLSAVAWIAGGVSEGQTRILWWLAALAIEYVSPAVYFFVPGLGRAVTGDWTVEGGHLAERVGLFIIICLGESILITGATFAGLTWLWPVVMAFAAAFLGTLAMWWIWFSAAHEAASDTIASSNDPGRVARRAYTYAPIVVVAGIIVTAVGDELALMHPEQAMSVETAAILIGGPSLFLIGAQAFKLAVFGIWSPARLTGIVVLAALWAVALTLTPLALAWAATGVLVAVAGWETLALRKAS